MAAVMTNSNDGGIEKRDSADVVMENGEGIEDDEPSSLIIPITSGTNSDLFVEIFPEEMADTPSSTLLPVLKDEDAPVSVWADAALLYMHYNKQRDASSILQVACDRPGGSREERVRVLASAGIAYLTQAQHQQQQQSSSSTDPKEELRNMADNRFTNAFKLDTLFPMTWMGRGMLNLNIGRLEQARFFFETTLKQCGQVLPALLGMAAVLYGEKDYKGAQEMYGKAMRLYPSKSGAATRVGFGLACYRLGQVDRAKAAFARALQMDHESVEAMVGSAILDMAGLDETSKDFNSRTEKAIKMMSMANLLDHSNAMVQNHLSNHYFWKWTPVAGTVQVTQGSNVVKGSQPIPLDPGERIRIGTTFESYVAEDDNMNIDDEDSTMFKMKNEWKDASISGLKVWKKDYDRVIALAKGAYNSTSVQEIQAESLFFLARVYHAREDMTNAHKFYERACKLAPDLSPARFGLAQTLIAQDELEQAAAHLQLVLGTSSTATDAQAALGLLKVKAAATTSSAKPSNPASSSTTGAGSASAAGSNASKQQSQTQEGLTHLRKAIDLEPLNPDLVLLEALALQQQESNYSKSLERYKKAVQLMVRQGRKTPFEVFTNIGVLCHELKQYDEALDMYKRGLEALDDGEKGDLNATLDNVGIPGGKIRHVDNDMFFDYVNSELKVSVPNAKLKKEGEDSEENSNDDLKILTITDSSDKEISSIPLVVGDHIRVGEFFISEIVELSKTEGGPITVKVKDEYEDFDDFDNNEDEKNKDDGDNPNKATQKILDVLVKRENKRLDLPSAISIAFNLARLHEAVGRTLAAVELHKAIVKRSPAYVNSYLRLACIAIDCGSLKECSDWLKIAAKTSPGNPEVLTLIGNLHLSLCDWAPAQQVFDGLLAKKVPNVEAYAMLSLGNIYFANLKVSPKRYPKHLQYAADYYKRILTKDTANAYAANGLGTVLAEKGELFKAKEVFNRVREVSGDTIADAHLNLGHIFLAQKKHPEALQMYQSYLKRTEDGTAPITSKSRVDDAVDVLMYIAFAYFDWARQTELFNNAKAAPADERYKKAMENLQLALSKNTSKSIVLTYNLCMTKLQAANCVLQKLTRNIRRTAKEVEEALNGLEESLVTVEGILKQKTEQAIKVPIATSMLNDFVSHCKSNMDSARQHLEDERKREEQANEIRQLQQLAAEAQRKEQMLREHLKKEEEAKKQEERDRKAYAKMRQVEDLRAGWQHEQQLAQAASEKKSKKTKNPAAPEIVDDDDDGLFPEEGDDNQAPRDTNALFEDSDDESGNEKPKEDKSAKASNNAALFDDTDDESDSGGKKETKKAGDDGGGGDDDDDKAGEDKSKEDTNPKEAPKFQELFGGSDDDDDESDEELVRSGSKRANDKGGDDGDDENAAKKRKLLDDDDE